MSTPASGGRAGHEHDRDVVDEDVAGPPSIEGEGDTEEDLASAVPGVEREGEYTDSDVGPDDTDPPVGSYVSRDVTP